MDILNEEFGPAGPVGFLPETDPLFCAVLENNLNKLKTLVESGRSVNLKNYRGSLLLNVVIEHRRTEIFDYLLSLAQLEVDAVDNFGRSALLYAASEAPDDYYVLELINKGADVNIADKSGATFLIRAASRMEAVHLNVGQLAIEKGANVDAKSANGVTPLFAACEMGNFDWVCMLLYYGADSTVVPDDAVLPVVKLSHHLPDDQLNHLQEVLYNYIFDDTKINVQLRTLVGAMLYETPIFPKIVEITQDVSYDLSDLELFHAELTNIKPKNLILFLQKFGNIVKKMIENFPPLNMLRRVRCPIFIDFDLGYPNDDIVRMKEIFDVFLESQFAADFVQTADPSFPSIFRLIDVFRRNRIFVKNEEEEITRMVCVMLSYGLTVTAADAHAVYTYYGYCELFKILLHMDIDISHAVTRGCAIPRLCYDPCQDIEDFADIFPSVRLLDYYSLPKVKQLYLAATTNEEIVSKVKKLPPVPPLVELSRNASRKYIVKRFNIQNSKQFYTVLKWLPIGEMNKRIISLEKKLY